MSERTEGPALRNRAGALIFEVPKKIEEEKKKMSRKVFVLLAFAMVLMVLIAACATPPVPAPKVVGQTVVVPQTVVVQATQVPATAGAKLDNTLRIAVESAFSTELQLLLSKMTVEKTYVVNGQIFTTGKLAGKNVVAFLSGVSMINAAMTTQQAFDNFNITHLVFSGIAGGVNPSLNVGDVAVPAQWAQYQEVRFARQNPDGSFAGTSDLPNFGMAFPSTISVVRKSGEPGKTIAMRWFPVDAGMLKAANNIVAAAPLNRCGKDKSGNQVCLTNQPKIKVGGNGVSGQTFVDNKQFREYAWNVFQADSLDMESAAVAQVAYVNEVPSLQFRSLSDLAGGGPGENEIGTFFSIAADNSAGLLLKFLETWTPGQASPVPTVTSIPTTVPKATQAVTPVKFGVVLVGPYNDHGWSEAHYTAAQYVKSKLPGSDFIYIDKLNPADRPGTTLEQVANDMKSKGVKLILTTSDDFQTDTLTVAQKFPDLTFINVSGDNAWKDGKNFKAPANLGNFMGKMEYGKMVAGCSAALTTQTGKIGFLGPLINDETRRLADAAYLGAKYCWTNVAKKDAAALKFDVKWIGFWFNIPGVTLDPTKVANDFYNAGNDIVISGIDTTEALVVAGQRGKKGEKVWAISYDYKDGCAEAPDVCLGVPYFNWGPRYLKTVQTFRDGAWKSSWDWDGPDWKDLNNPDTGAVGFTFGKALSADNKTKVETFIKGLADGSINLWKGPLTLQDGIVYVKVGAVATDKEIWYLPQLLQGMSGTSAPAK